MVIEGEAKDKVYGIIADAIDVMRLYQDACRLAAAYKAENEELLNDVDRLDGEARDLQGQIAALEHTVSELNERNDRLEMKLDVAKSKEAAENNWQTMYEIARHTLGDVESDVNWLTVLDNRLGQYVEMHEPSLEEKDAYGEQAEGEGWKIRARLVGQSALLEHKLFVAETELEKYKALARSLFAWASESGQACLNGLVHGIMERMIEEGYDLEKEPIEELGSSGSEDNSEGADEHDFL